MSFLREIKDSIYNPSFYSSIIARPFSSSLRYFLKVALVVYVLISIMIAPALIVGAKSNFLGAISGLKSVYPDELVITIQNGKASTNISEPYVISATGIDMSKSDSTFANLLVIDTTHTVDIKTARGFNSLVVLTEADLLTFKNSKNGEVRVIPLENIDNFVINNEKIDRWAGTAESIFSRYFIFFAIACAVGLVLLVIIGKFIYLFIASLLVWLLARILGHKIGYRKSYQISLHAITLPLLTLILMVPLSISYPNGVFTLFMLLVVVLNIKKSAVASTTSV